MKFFSGVLGVIFLLCLVKAQETIVDTLEATKDAFVDANLPDANYGNEEFLAVHQIGDSEVNSIFVHFDMSHIIGPSSTQQLEDPPMLDKATLEFFCTTSYGSGLIHIDAPIAFWDENGITFNNQPYLSGVHNITWTVNDEPGSRSGYDVTDHIGSRYFITDPEENHGMNIKYESETGDVGADFHSKETPSAFETQFVYSGPTLILEYHYAAVEEDNAVSIPQLSVSPVTHSSASISFSMPNASTASLSVYDASGSLVQTLTDGHLQAGNYTAVFTSSPGVYFIRLEMAHQALSRKFVVAG